MPADYIEILCKADIVNFLLFTEFVVLLLYIRKFNGNAKNDLNDDENVSQEVLFNEEEDTIMT